MALPVNSLYSVAAAITPSDTVNIDVGAATKLPTTTDAVWVGGAGVVAAILQSGAVVNFTCVAGSLLPIKAKRINSTNTTATLLVALYA